MYSTRLWLAICLLVAVALPAWAQEEAAPTRAAVRTLSVTGTAQTRERPDLATVTLGLETQAAELTPAIAQNNRAMEAVVAAIRKLGIAARDIQTANFSVFPLYRSRPTPQGDEEQQLIGYRVSNLVTVRTENMDRVGPIIDAGMAAGANQVTGVGFSLRDDLGARSRALGAAAREARAKAEALADALGLRLGPVVAVSEQGAQVRPVFTEAMARFAGAPGPTPISPGQVEVSATVSLTYQLQ